MTTAVVKTHTKTCTHTYTKKNYNNKIIIIIIKKQYKPPS